MVEPKLSIDGVPIKPVTEEFLHYDGHFTYHGPDLFLFEVGRLMKMDIADGYDLLSRVVKVESLDDGGVEVYFRYAEQ